MATKKNNGKNGIVCFGELVVDCFGSIVDGFTPKFGGAPGNTAVGLAKLGQKNISFVGKVGADFFGDFLDTTLQSYGVNTTHLFRNKQIKTTLAFVARGPQGARDFSFYAGAHETINPSEVSKIHLKKARILQFGSLTQTNTLSAKATTHLLKTAKREQVFISYDPNVRLPLWSSKIFLKETITTTIPYVNMLKVNEEELLFLTGTKNPRNGAKKLWHKNLQLLLITLGPKGAYWKTRHGEGLVETLSIRPIDTTGAGDAFNAGLLFQLFPFVQNGILEVETENVPEYIGFANRVAALSTLKRGAIEALPTIEEVKRLA